MTVLGIPETGELVVGTGTPIQQCPRIQGGFVCFQGHPSNLGIVYIGADNVTAPTGVENTTAGLGLAATILSNWIPITLLDKFYFRGTSAGDSLLYFVLK